MQHKGPFRTLLFDSWYLAEELVAMARYRNKDWISLLKKHRNLETNSFLLKDATGHTIPLEGPHIAVAALVPLSPRTAYRAVTVGDTTYGTFTLAVRLPGLGTREVHVAGVTPHPNQAWMLQSARHITMEEWGFLSPGQYLIHDRDGKYCPAFQQRIDAAGITRVPLPPRSPNLHAYAERWGRSVKEECLSRLILFGERSLSHILKEYVAHYHQERPHQGKGNVVLLPSSDQDPARQGPIQYRERLGGLLKYYARDAA